MYVYVHIFALKSVTRKWIPVGPIFYSCHLFFYLNHTVTKIKRSQDDNSNNNQKTHIDAGDTKFMFADNVICWLAGWLTGWFGYNSSCTVRVHISHLYKVRARFTFNTNAILNNDSDLFRNRWQQCQLTAKCTEFIRMP